MKKTILLIIPLSAFCLCKSSEPVSRLNYINSKYKFSMQFIESWENYNDIEKAEIIDSGMDVPVIYFSLPTRMREWQSPNVPSGFSELFYVRIFNREKWDLYKAKYEGASEFRLSDKIIDEGKNFVYVIRFASSVPVDLHYYVREIVPITDTFRVLK